MRGAFNIQYLIVNCILFTAENWLLPAFYCLTMAPTLIQRCIPENQAFDDKYAGIFRFRFWRYGEWIELCIDDRLPTYNGLLTIHIIVM